jgi:hypothetical protein
MKCSATTRLIIAPAGHAILRIFEIQAIYQPSDINIGKGPGMRLIWSASRSSQFTVAMADEAKLELRLLSERKRARENRDKRNSKVKLIAAENQN